MEYLNEKNKSGIIKYFGSFKDSVEEIRKELTKSKETNIYLMYGSTILNTLSEEINFSLSKKGNIVNIYIMDESNPFILASAGVWGESNQSHTIEKITGRIEDTIQLFNSKQKELSKDSNLKGELNVYKNIKSPVNFSFYLFDDKVYYVPSKNVSTKEFIPITILGQKTADSNSLFNKVKLELDLMKKDDSFKKIEFDEK